MRDSTKGGIATTVGLLGGPSHLLHAERRYGATVLASSGARAHCYIRGRPHQKTSARILRPELESTPRDLPKNRRTISSRRIESRARFA